jgi:hypothetical protein
MPGVAQELKEKMVGLQQSPLKRAASWKLIMCSCNCALNLQGMEESTRKFSNQSSIGSRM